MATRRGLVLALQSLEKLVGQTARSSYSTGMLGCGLLGCGAGLAGLSLAASSGSAVNALSKGCSKNGIKENCRFFGSALAEAVERSGSGIPLDLFPPITLYQYEVCPFCCKVKAFLDYHKIPYEAVEVNPLTKGELKWSQYKKVPVITLGDEQLNDSSFIITKLAEKIDEWKSEQQTKTSWFKKTDSQTSSNDDELKWRKWVDERFVRIITANIYRSWGESWTTFDYITEHGNFNIATRHAARVFGTTLMWGIGMRMPKKYNITGDLREALYAAANDWVDAVGEREFMGGNEPNLADLAVFGVIRSVVGTPAFNDLMHNSSILPWYKRMMDSVGSSSRTNPKST